MTVTGAHRGVLVVMMTDDWVITPEPDGYLWGNFISIHVMQPEVEGMAANEWVVRACEKFCGAMEIGHGFACVEKEYEAKNKVGYRYTGLDPMKHLPGMYWLNVFGKEYVKLIGKGKLMGMPGAQTQAAGGHVIARFGDEPLAWRTGAYRRDVNRALDHVGRKYFFDKKARRRETVGPKFPLQFDPADSEKSPRGTVEVDLVKGEIRVKQGRTVLKTTPLTGQD